MESINPEKKTRREYYNAVNEMGKKEYTFLKMQEYGFWPQGLPTPYERQKNESPEEFRKRKELIKEYERISCQIADLYGEKDQINKKMKELRKQYGQTWDSERIRKDVGQQIMQESLARRAARKEQKEREKQRVSEAWKKRKAENIVFIGRGYSGLLYDKTDDEEKLQDLKLPLIQDDKALAALLGITDKELRFLAYHRDVEVVDHYHRYEIAKRNGGQRTIAAPKPLLKKAQRIILSEILEKIAVSEQAHGFLKGRSVVSGAAAHTRQPALLINIDLENFFPSITFARVRGMFKSFGYSGYIASLLAMLCTYCERAPIEVKGRVKYVKASERILPQGSPASPMITNILCRRLDARMNDLAASSDCTYTRYADDMSFSFAGIEETSRQIDPEKIKKFIYAVQRIIYDEGFRINREKTRYLKKNNRQTVTGLVINNDEITVPRVWIKKMRAALFNAVREKEKGALNARKISEISGMACWLQSVNPHKYRKLIDEARCLMADKEKSLNA